MNNYIVLLFGKGDGCDYTIGCNQKIVKIQAATDEEATIKAKWLCGDYAPDQIDSIEVYSVSQPLYKANL